ncbi:MAG: bleomycin resistance protein [Jatrophihabitans sp.]|uniref:bleomycin resistance protein n=1 Tax=Jatrophihabitans sp. TaxID=1932789 RepID=UPI0039123AB9
MGWTELWDDGGLVLLSLAGKHMMLQDHYVKQWAENTMITVVVNSADDWYDKVSSVLASGSYDDARVEQPKDEGWARVTYVWDPCGVLLHFAQFPQRP